MTLTGGSTGEPRVERIEVSAYRVPTDAPESDGTYRWEATTLVVVHAQAGGATGIGFSYADASAASLIGRKLAPLVTGAGAMDVQRAWDAMVHSVRNAGRPGIASTAISAVDVALWDLKARLLGLPLVSLLGAARDDIPVYGSGGFTSYSDERLAEQFSRWAASGIRMLKMKVGREPEADPHRVEVARRAVGDGPEIFVDANGAYSRKQALAMAEAFASQGVTWFEEPVSSDDLQGLRLVRDRAPAGMSIAAGEYGYDSFYFERMLDAEAVDVLQADATRCGGFTGFLRAAALCDAHGVPLSAHTAPALHVHACCAVSPAVNLEYFHDHVRIEEMLFDGARRPQRGRLHPDRSRPGLGLEIRRGEAERYRI